MEVPIVIVKHPLEWDFQLKLQIWTDEDNITKLNTHTISSVTRETEAVIWCSQLSSLGGWIFSFFFPTISTLFHSINRSNIFGHDSPSSGAQEHMWLFVIPFYQYCSVMRAILSFEILADTLRQTCLALKWDRVTPLSNPTSMSTNNTWLFTNIMYVTKSVSDNHWLCSFSSNCVFLSYLENFWKQK